MGMSVGGSSGGPVSEPNIVPLIDVLLVLIIIFMVITPLLQKGLPVNMAKAENADKMPNADRDDAVIVAVTRDGHMFLGSKEIQEGVMFFLIHKQCIPQLSPDIFKNIIGRRERFVVHRHHPSRRLGLRIRFPVGV